MRGDRFKSLTKLMEKADIRKKATGSARKGRKKPVGAPKQRLSAYNLFYQFERQRMLTDRSTPPLPSLSSEEVEESSGSSQTQQLGFARLTRCIAEKWKVVDPATRNYFEKLAELDRQRYDQELQAWKSTRNLPLRSKSYSPVTKGRSVRQISLPTGNPLEEVIFAKHKEISKSDLDFNVEASHLPILSFDTSEAFGKSILSNTGNSQGFSPASETSCDLGAPMTSLEMGVSDIFFGNRHPVPFYNMPSSMSDGNLIFHNMIPEDFGVDSLDERVSAHTFSESNTKAPFKIFDDPSMLEEGVSHETRIQTSQDDDELSWWDHEMAGIEEESAQAAAIGHVPFADLVRHASLRRLASTLDDDSIDMFVDLFEKDNHNEDQHQNTTGR